MITQKNKQSKFVLKTNTLKRIPSQSVIQNILQDISQNSSDFQTSFGANTSQKQDNILLSHQINQCNKQNQQKYMAQSTNINKKQKSVKIFSTKILEPPTKTSLNNIQQIDLQFLNPLKTKYPTQFLYKNLKQKTFDFNVQFYKHALQLILYMGFQYQPDYCFLCQQAQICENIHRLTQQYSAAVEQNIQDIVKTNLLLSRKLCAQLKSKKIAVIVKKYLKMNGQSLNYKAGKLAFKAQVEKQLIEKVIREKNENFVEAVTVLFLLTNFGQIQSTRIFLQQFNKYLKTNCFIQSSQQIEIKLTDTIRKYTVPLMNILLIGLLFIEDQPSKNIKKFLQFFHKNCQKMTSQQIKLLPSYYITYFAQLSNREFMNIYTLKSQLKQFIEEHPICFICLKAVQRHYSNKDQLVIQKNSRYCHAQCFQLIKFINTSRK